MIHDLGYLGSGLTGSLELVVICDEVVSWIKAFMGVIEVNEETLALDIIHRHALSENYLETDHTLRQVRGDWQPDPINPQNYDQWVDNGATSTRERARSKVEEILSSEPQRVLEPRAEKAIGAIAHRAAAMQGK